MEQATNQPDEPKITPQGGRTTPPAALFLPPAVPTQAVTPTEESDEETNGEPDRKPDKGPSKARKAAAKRNPDFTPPTMPTTAAIPTSTPAPAQPTGAAATQPSTAALPKPELEADPELEPEPEPETAPAPARPTSTARTQASKPRKAPAKPPAAYEKTAIVEPEAPETSETPEPPTTRRPRSTKAPSQTVDASRRPAGQPAPATSAIPKARAPRAKAVEPAATNEHRGTRTQVFEVTSADLWAAMKAEPRRAPAALAMAVVRQWGPAAAKQANWLRARYPGVSTDRLARIAQRNGAIRTRMAIVASAPFAGLGGLPVYAWAHSRLVLEVAAIYGHDPTDPRRAADLLVLTGVYQDLYDAEAAVNAVLDQEREVPLVPTMAIGAAPHLIRRVAGKLLPGAGLVLDGLASAAATDDLAARAGRFYRDRVTADW